MEISNKMDEEELNRRRNQKDEEHERIKQELKATKEENENLKNALAEMVNKLIVHDEPNSPVEEVREALLDVSTSMSNAFEDIQCDLFKKDEEIVELNAKLYDAIDQIYDLKEDLYNAEKELKEAREMILKLEQASSDDENSQICDLVFTPPRRSRMSLEMSSTLSPIVEEDDSIAALNDSIDIELKDDTTIYLSAVFNGAQHSILFSDVQSSSVIFETKSDVVPKSTNENLTKLHEVEVESSSVVINETHKPINRKILKRVASMPNLEAKLNVEINLKPKTKKKKLFKKLFEMAHL